jgi:pimeloyl-ACP methyl ester carboxylesterase
MDVSEMTRDLAMALKSGLLTALGLLALSASTQAADNVDVPGSLDTSRYHVEYVKLGAENLDGLLYEPKGPGSHSHIALVSVFPRAGFGPGAPEELASRGYSVLKIQPYVEHDSPYDGVAEASAGIAYMRTLPGIDRVLIMGHSGGAHLAAFYTNVALNGPKACQRPALLYPCDIKKVSNLARPDGAVLLDPGVGPINTALSIDPAYIGDKRERTDLDMFAPANGYDPKAGTAIYSPEFLKRYYATQSARNMAIVNRSIERLKVVQQGKGNFSKDEPLAIPGMFNDVNGPSPSKTEVSLLSHTKLPHLVLKTDGSMAQEVVRSIRPPVDPEAQELVGSLCCYSLNYSLRAYLANDAIRTTKDFAVKDDDVVGIDWNSSVDSPIVNAQGITVPTLVLVNTCYRLVVTGEILFDHIAAKDKTYVAVEGALHGFTPCRPEFGDTKKRAFDFVDNWLGKSGRF